MPCILHIETSTKVCSVALSQDGKLLYHHEDFDGPSHSEMSGVYVDEALSFANSHAIPVDAVAVSMGPGSYTGLRIGVSLAKGVCYGRDLPLIAVPTLKVLCVPILLGKEELPEDALLVPMIDARRMEVYSAVYDRALKEIRPIQADVVTSETYQEFLDRGPVYFFGNGAQKCQVVIQHPNAHFIDGIHPLAKNMFPLAERSMHLEEFQDVAYFEPYYLKEFVAIKSKPLL
ncbi:MAG: tRNA (adenosine(37)-N6)-threonylcarbamoyltransferase complex dimerization subunit type 1 TsaB [Bacteroidaceae bacterium]|nr:tRNA (adenosine(37)-N6)-threonylcarbamoyltransferase complex dimerization subunit type 1 TsaB [Bacteroidaceae bacterium]